jgi:hypothetical protein
VLQPPSARASASPARTPGALRGILWVTVVYNLCRLALHRHDPR